MHSDILPHVSPCAGLKVTLPCEEPNVTFVSYEQVSYIQVGILLQGNSNEAVNALRCGEVTELPFKQSNECHTIGVHRDNIVLRIDSKDEVCDETSIYAPDLRPTG